MGKLILHAFTFFARRLAISKTTVATVPERTNLRKIHKTKTVVRQAKILSGNAFHTVWVCLCVPELIL